MYLRMLTLEADKILASLSPESAEVNAVCSCHKRFGSNIQRCNRTCKHHSGFTHNPKQGNAKAVVEPPPRGRPPAKRCQSSRSHSSEPSTASHRPFCKSLNFSKKMSEKIFSKLPQWFNLEEKDHMEKPIEATITGDVPKWIKGSLYRNGSGIYKMGSTAWNHIFDGFAVLQRWTFQNGKVTYQSSILDSDDYKKSAERNRMIGSGFGSTFPDPCQTLFSRLLSTFVPARPDKVTNTAVNIVEFGDRMFALSETPVINEVTADTLKVKGKVSLYNDMLLFF
ncbi:hypothetical protein RRG08_025396 [Elysia crispata]|uniref:Uncharacterized protein n=1 Tax=Elysia crispata TaxID=231223 RepID=A0AAE0Z8R6_9GAST|nr:hypothetical protein RRG08_025396 [Elysia crispata]